MRLRVFCGIEGKGLTVHVECNDEPQYSDSQRHNNFVPVPNCNTSGISEHLTLRKLFLHETVDDDVRAKDNQY